LKKAQNIQVPSLFDGTVPSRIPFQRASLLQLTCHIVKPQMEPRIQRPQSSSSPRRQGSILINRWTPACAGVTTPAFKRRASDRQKEAQTSCMACEFHIRIAFVILLVRSRSGRCI
jgi:hypothetical protein